MSHIDAYLQELEQHLRDRRLPRRRLLAEAEDHLRVAAAQLAADGREPGTAEELAVQRFGSAALVARSVAATAATWAASRALAATAAAWLALCVAAVSFGLAAPDLYRDFPQGLATALGLQLAAVALIIAALRARHLRKAGLLPESRIRPLAVASAIAASALAASVAAEIAVALTRPAGVLPWGTQGEILSVFIVAAGAALVAVLAAAAACGRSYVMATLPLRPEETLPGAEETLLEDATGVHPFLAQPTQRLLTHPVRACAIAALIAAAAVATSQALSDDYLHHASVLAGAAAVGVLEATAVAVCYFLFGRALGIRPGAPRRVAA